MKKVSFLRVLGIGVALLVPAIVFGQATKVSICHTTGNGSFQLLSIASSAVKAHQNHGDIFPGTTINKGDTYDGQYGSTVQAVTLVGDDCSQTDALRIDSTQNFSQGQPAGVSAGWAGWSCIEPGFPHVLSGGVVPEDGTVKAQGPAKQGAAAIDGYNYPVYPNYHYPSGEEGWVVEAAGPTPPTGIYVVCGK